MQIKVELNMNTLNNRSIMKHFIIIREAEYRETVFHCFDILYESKCLNDK